jgi:flagellin
MPLNSVNTNIAAQVALQSLNTTTTQLQSAQKAISTGYRVADATDDGGAFSVAQRVRGDVAAITTVNQQLGNAKGLVGTALSSLTTISNYLTSAKSLLVDIGNASIPQAQRDQYVAWSRKSPIPPTTPPITARPSSALPPAPLLARPHP